MSTCSQRASEALHFSRPCVSLRERRAALRQTHGPPRLGVSACRFAPRAGLRGKAQPPRVMHQPADEQKQRLWLGDTAQGGPTWSTSCRLQAAAEEPRGARQATPPREASLHHAIPSVAPDLDSLVEGHIDRSRSGEKRVNSGGGAEGSVGGSGGRRLAMGEPALQWRRRHARVVTTNGAADRVGDGGGGGERWRQLARGGRASCCCPRCIREDGGGRGVGGGGAVGFG